MGFKIEAFQNRYLAPGQTRVDAIVSVTSDPALQATGELVVGFIIDKSGSMAGSRIESVTQAELRAAEAALAALRARVQKDPLGARGTLGYVLRPRLAALHARLEGELARRDRVLAARARAGELLRRIGEGNARARRLVERVAREVELPPGTPAPQPVEEGQIEGLEHWMGKLAQTVEARRWAPAEVGLGRWLATAEEYLGTDAGAAKEAESLLAVRGELAGRLSARRAQAAALVARGAVLDASAEAHAREAEALLQRKPTPIAAAAREVELYEAAVVSAGRR